MAKLRRPSGRASRVQTLNLRSTAPLTDVEIALFDALHSAGRVLEKLGVTDASDIALATCAAALMQRENTERLLSYPTPQQRG